MATFIAKNLERGRTLDHSNHESAALVKQAANRPEGDLISRRKQTGRHQFSRGIWTAAGEVFGNKLHQHGRAITLAERADNVVALGFDNTGCLATAHVQMASYDRQTLLIRGRAIGTEERAWRW